jgi:hypothetical protein
MTELATESYPPQNIGTPKPFVVIGPETLYGSVGSEHISRVIQLNRVTWVQFHQHVKTQSRLRSNHR